MVRVSSLGLKGLKKRLSGFSDHFTHGSSQPGHDPSSTETPAEDDSAASLPVPAASFPSLLAKSPDTTTRELVGPYLQYETSLRKAYAAWTDSIAEHANLVPVYDGLEELFTIRDVDRRNTDDEKYLMPLHDSEREKGGSLAITPSLEEYKKDFDAFTHGQ